MGIRDRSSRFLGGACFGLCVGGDGKHLTVHLPEEVEVDAWVKDKLT